MSDPFIQDLIKIVLTSLLSSGVMSSLIALIMYKVQRRDRLKDEAKANDTVLSLMVRGLCHDKIIYLTDKYIERGGLTVREMTNLTAIYNPYRQGGGNGECKTGYEACDELPLITEEEARERDLKIKWKMYNLKG